MVVKPDTGDIHMSVTKTLRDTNELLRYPEEPVQQFKNEVAAEINIVPLETKPLLLLGLIENSMRSEEDSFTTVTCITKT